MKAQDEHKPDSLIFDLDGTLWDAVETYVLAWNEYFRIKAIDYRVNKALLDSGMGLEQKLYLEKLIPQFPISQRVEIYNDVIKIQNKLIETLGGTMYEGVFDGLKSLAGKYKLFIVSNCPEFTIPHFMKWSGLGPYINDYMEHGQNFKSKAENIQLLIEKHSLKKPLYIGDTDSDAVQCAKAGVPFILMEYGFGSTEACYKRFGSFSEFSNYYIN